MLETLRFVTDFHWILGVGLGLMTVQWPLTFMAVLSYLRGIRPFPKEDDSRAHSLHRENGAMVEPWMGFVPRHQWYTEEQLGAPAPSGRRKDGDDVWD